MSPVATTGSADGRLSRQGLESSQILAVLTILPACFKRKRYIPHLTLTELSKLPSKNIAE